MSINGELVRKLRYDRRAIKKKNQEMTWSDLKICILSIAYSMLPFYIKKEKETLEG